MHWERIVDVNLNRLSESLKFIEDIIRFSLRNKILLVSIRKIRRDFLKIKKVLPLSNLISFRESRDDLGRPASFDSRTNRDTNDPLIANLTRTKESSRIIEEILKTKNLKVSNKMKELRFKIYDLEKAVLESLKKKFNPKLCAIIDEKYLIKSQISLRDAVVKNIVNILESNGATMIQLRMKRSSDKEFFNWAEKIKKHIAKPELKFIINNRIDIALACRADGIHLGQDDLPIKKARAILGNSFIIGSSAHNIKQAKMAEVAGADYIGVGAIFKTTTKPEAKICGLKTLRTITQKIKIPVIGIGGINNKNCRLVFNAGASGVAVSSYLFEGDLRKNIRSLTFLKM